MPRIRRSFNAYLKNSGRSGWLYKLIDGGFQMPFDCFGVISPGTAFAFENKICRSVDTINVKQLFSNREHQISNLMRLKNIGSICWILIAMKGNSREFHLYAMRPEIAAGLLQNGSSKVDELLDQGMLIECPSIGEGNWDLTPLFL
jgi:penicillin-binding protein-related factor A (putative recombinase)